MTKSGTTAKYEHEKNLLNEKIKLLALKAQLKKAPKLKIHKEKNPLACYNGVYHSISFSEKALDKWHEGIYDEQYIDYILAHETGHAIGTKLKSHHTKRLKILFTVLIAILVSIYSRTFLPSLFLQSIVLIISILGLLFWAFCIPWVVREIFACSELEADANAVAYNLIDAQEMARQIMRKANLQTSTLTLSPFEIITFAWNVFTHPTVSEQLQNLNFKVKEPVEVEKRARLEIKASTKEKSKISKIQLKPFYIPLIFIFLCLVAALIYLFFQVSGFNTLAGTGGTVLAFLTSPFNFLEDFTGNYEWPQQGYLYNTVVTVIFLFFATFYYYWITENKRFSIERVFWASIIGSYGVSIVVWAIKGWPSTGTSIIGFCVVGYLLGLSFFDFKRQRNKTKFSSRLRNLIILPTLLVSCIILPTAYLLGNDAYPYHLAGGGICAILLLLLRRKQSSKS